MDVPRGPRWDPVSIRTFLNRLDRAVRPHHGPDFRRCERYPYRVKALTVEVLDEDEQVAARYATAGRNLTRGGVSFINEGMIYPGSTCRVRLVGPHGHEQPVRGRVVHCRYIMGSVSLHEVGVKFDRVIDLALFAPRARFVRILLADADPGVRELLGGFLHSLNVELTSGVIDPAEVIKAALDRNYDLVLLDLENRGVDAFAIATQLRNLGFVGPIVGLAVQVPQRLYERCIQAGFTGYLRKPIARQAVRELVTSLLDRPLVSSMAHDPHLVPLIDRFVQQLPERAKGMAAALKRGDVPVLNQLAHEIRGAAGSYGFSAITEAATDLQLQIASEAPPARLRHSLDQLLHLCLTARPASCGDLVPVRLG